jgi:2-keto-4-pentenoate hydratase/2-oxohepta-3-ene-1,7-dioic acid hydratase in catechol pathway
MKILRFGDDRIGVLKNEDRVVDVSESIKSRVEKGPQRVIEEVIEQFHLYRSEFEKRIARETGVPLQGLKLLAPIPRPCKCLGAFLNYLDKPDRTLDTLIMEFFYKSPELLAPEGTIDLLDIPGVTSYVPEAELAFVIGKTAKNVKEEDAMNYVFGYVPFFDVSARGLSRPTNFLAKGQDTYGPCGPWITIKEEIPDPHKLSVRSWVNGQLKQNFNTKDMAYKIPQQIAWLSRFVRLQPGDIISTGTHHEGLTPMHDGEVLEIEIEKMGKARFHVKGYGARKDLDHGGPPKLDRPMTKV